MSISLSFHLSSQELWLAISAQSLALMRLIMELENVPIPRDNMLMKYAKVNFCPLTDKVIAQGHGFTKNLYPPILYNCIVCLKELCLVGPTIQKALICMTANVHSDWLLLFFLLLFFWSTRWHQTAAMKSQADLWHHGLYPLHDPRRVLQGPLQSMQHMSE